MGNAVAVVVCKTSESTLSQTLRLDSVVFHSLIDVVKNAFYLFSLMQAFRK